MFCMASWMFYATRLDMDKVEFTALIYYYFALNLGFYQQRIMKIFIGTSELSITFYGTTWAKFRY